MLHDLVILMAIGFIIGLAIYLMQFPVERGLTFRGEPTLTPLYKAPAPKAEKHKKHNHSPFRSFK